MTKARSAGNLISDCPGIGFERLATSTRKRYQSGQGDESSEVSKCLARARGEHPEYELQLP